MAGHSKWTNIQHHKGRQDDKRDRAWTLAIPEIMVAARRGSGNPLARPRRWRTIDKTKTVNLLADAVKRNFGKTTGNLENFTYEPTGYEGYGVGGAARVVDYMIDNHVRKGGEVRTRIASSTATSAPSARVPSRFGTADSRRPWRWSTATVHVMHSRWAKDGEAIEVHLEAVALVVGWGAIGRPLRLPADGLHDGLPMS